MAEFWSWSSPSVGSCSAGAPASRLRPRPDPPARFRAALAGPAYRAALAASFADGWAVFGGRVALVPLLVVEALGQPEAWGGIAPRCVRRGQRDHSRAGRAARRRPILVGLAVSGVATGPLGFVTSPRLFLAASLVAGMGSGLVNPPMNAAVADVIGSRAGRQRARRFPDGRRRARRDRRPGARGHAGRARRVRHGLRRDGSRGARRVRLLAPRARDPARASASTAGEESLAECSVAECPPGGRI